MTPPLSERGRSPQRLSQMMVVGDNIVVLSLTQTGGHRSGVPVGGGPAADQLDQAPQWFSLMKVIVDNIVVPSFTQTGGHRSGVPAQVGQQPRQVGPGRAINCTVPG